ncbi:hypothetical protein ACHAWO_005977 [Cyclotella atomus]|uniref:Uncharacterized protein n=1 Tax=Cyclotella atomus TaxID=382360 RepID=A0ABD3PBY5_9STRA
MASTRLFRPRSSSADEETDVDIPYNNTTAFEFGDSNDAGLTISHDDFLPSEPSANFKMLDYTSSSSSNGNNPCASNDAGSDYLTPCSYDYDSPRPAFLSCIASDANELLFEYDASATVFEYDYELHTPDYEYTAATAGGRDAVSFVEIVDEFQNGLAGSLAADFGVYCTHFDTTDGDGDGDSRRLGKEVVTNDTDDAIGGGGMYAPVCLGVSSSPSDVADDFITKCIIETPQPLPNSTKCTPMKGYITLYSRGSGNNRRMLTSTLDSIRNYIEQQTESYTSENILAVSYIGQRESVGVGIINPSLLSRPNGNGKRRVLIGTSESAAATVDSSRESGGHVDSDSNVCLAMMAAFFVAAAAAASVLTVVNRRQRSSGREKNGSKSREVPVL